jgi:hypothetical protein
MQGQCILHIAHRTKQQQAQAQAQPRQLHYHKRKFNTFQQHAACRLMPATIYRSAGQSETSLFAAHRFSQEKLADTFCKDGVISKDPVSARQALVLAEDSAVTVIQCVR